MITDLCDNCNQKGGRFKVTITATPADYDQTDGRKWHFLCGACRSALMRLDFAEFIQRHEGRRRTMELP